MSDEKRLVLIAGATGYLGQKLVKAYSEAGYHVRALARRPEGLVSVTAYVAETFIGEVTNPDTLHGCCDGVDLVVSTIGITRQKDGLTYDQVDYRANGNLLREAISAGVKRFAYIHVLNAEGMPHVEMAKAKAKFAAELADSPIDSTILCPSGFFSDLNEILQMAHRKRVYLFGNGEALISPIDGSDLAGFCVEACEAGLSRVDVGGPETLSQNDIAKLAFEALSSPSRITHLPLPLCSFIVNVLKWTGMKSISGPLEFFLAASTMDMSAPAHGTLTLGEAFQVQANTMAKGN